MNKIIIALTIIFISSAVFSAEITLLEKTDDKQLKEINIILDQLKIQKKKSLDQLDKSNTEIRELDKKFAELDNQIKKNNIRRNDYINRYGFSQKMQRVYFDNKFLGKIGAVYKPVSNLSMNHKKYYKRLFDRYYNRWNIPNENRYNFPENKKQ